jgi:hypothetical protein
MIAEKGKMILMVLSMSLLGSVAILACKMIGNQDQSGSNVAEPVVVDPGGNGRAPSDAIVLFDGRDLSQWQNADHWVVKEGTAIVGAGLGGITTRRAFGDCQLHLEWSTSSVVEGSGQDRGNSGVYLQEHYEIQVLDSYQNKTYPDGMAGAVYGQYPPLANASRKPGEWQSYDIVFEGPRFDPQGKLLKPAFVTVLHNGVLIQNHVEIKGETGSDPPSYAPHASKMPLHLQDHGCPVRYRNIWVREL